MAFNVEEIKSIKLKSMDEIEEYAKEEKEKIKYIPIENSTKVGSFFSEDEFYGRGKVVYSFNQDGFSSLCQILNIPINFMLEIFEPNLTTHVLNDYITKKHVIERLNNHQFVIDTKTNTIIGVVSKSYQKYYNLSLLNDLKKYYASVYNDFEVTESYVINTNMYIRLLSPKIKAGLVTGIGGNSEDVSKVGLQLSNSLVGEGSVKITYYILRLMCANGLILESFSNGGKVMHSGKEETLEKRLTAAILPLVKGLSNIPRLLETLVSLEYNPEALVEIGGAEEVYKIIPPEQEIITSRKRQKDDKLKDFDINYISRYPDKYAGEYSRKIFDSKYRDNYSMFDFINIFTEYAHSKGISLKRRIEIEQKTGDLINWVIKNNQKLDKQNKVVKSRSRQMTLLDTW